MRGQPVVGRGRGGEQHRLDPRPSAASAQPARRVARPAPARRAAGRGRWRRRRRRRPASAAKRSWPVLDRVVVRHDDERDADVDLGAARRRSPAGVAPDLEGPPGRLLDGAAVHDRVGERDADLDGVGPGVGHGPHDVEPGRAEAAGHVRHEQLAARVPLRPQVASRGSFERLAEQLGHLLGVLVAPARQGDEHGRAGRDSPSRRPGHPGRGRGPAPGPG